METSFANQNEHSAPKKRVLLWCICVLCLIEAVAIIAGVAVYLQAPMKVTSENIAEPETPMEELAVEPVEELPSQEALTQQEKMELYLALQRAQMEAEAAYILAMSIDPVAPDWMAWRQEVTKAQTSIAAEQDRLQTELLLTRNLQLTDAQSIWAFALNEGRWVILPTDPIDAMADWYYRSGIRFYFAGGTENFTQAYYELSVATAFGHSLAEKLAEKIAPFVPEDQRNHALAFAINLQTLMMPVEEGSEVIE